MGRLEGKNCIITGASRGLGEAIARRFWHEGASLLLIARSRSALEDLMDSLPPAKEQQAFFLECDLAAESAPQFICRESEKRFTAIHTLVNNAAIQGPIGPAWTCGDEEWDNAVQVNFTAPAALCRKIIPIMDQRARCKIISISGGGATAARPNFSAYGTAKAALVRFSEILAAETREMNVDINCVAPGSMYSAMTDAVIQAGPAGAGDKEYQDALKTRQQAASQKDRAVDLCLFLASAASDGVSGKLISAIWDPWEKLPEHLGELSKSDIYTLRRIVPKERGFNWGDR